MICGMVFSLLGAILPDIVARLGIDQARSGLLPLSLYLGACLGMLTIAILIHLASTKIWMILSLGLFTFASFWACLSRSMFSLLPPLFILGFAHGIGILFCGMVVQRLTLGQGSRSMNTLFGFFALGVTVEPMLAVSILSRGGSFQTVTLVLGGCALVILLLSWLILPWGKEKIEALTLPKLKNLLYRYRYIALGLAGLQFLYVGAESIGNVWIPKYLMDTFREQVSVKEAGLMLSIFWAAITLGRWISAALSRVLSPFKILMVLGILALTGLTLAPGLSQLRGVEIALILLGFGLSGMVPFILASTERVPENLSSTAFAFVMMAGVPGGGVFSMLVGLISRSYEFRLGMWSGLFPITLLLIGFVLLHRRYELFS